MTAGAVDMAPRRISYCEYRLEFPAEHHSVHVVRAVVRVVCVSWHVSRSATDTAMLLASEVVTNAVAVSEGEVLRVTLRCVLGHLYFDCSDYDPTIPDTPSMPDAREPSGRGLALIKEFSSSYGWKELPGQQGKACWFTLAIR